MGHLSIALKSAFRSWTRIGFIICLIILPGIETTVAEAKSGQSSARPAAATSRSLAPVLLVDGGDTAEADQWYHTRMDSLFGVGNWDLYNMSEQGLPNPPELFLGVLGQYQGVLWHADISGMDHLRAASQILAEYVDGNSAGGPRGKLVLVAPPLRSVLYQIHDVLGVHPLAAPIESISIPAEKTALSLVQDLPHLTSYEDLVQCTGIEPVEGSEIIYQMEFCVRCYGTFRPPYDPVVAVRKPSREISVYAQTITMTIPLHKYPAGTQALETMMQFHMGFVPTSSLNTGAGLSRLSINNAGYIGNFFTDQGKPSWVYPYPGYVEHLYHGGIWVGGRKPDGSLHVSTSADHYGNSAEGQDMREFVPTEEEPRVISNNPDSENYDPEALAPWQMDCSFTDQMQPSSGDHTPLEIKVLLRAMSWNMSHIDDGVVLEYRVVNESGAELRDVYFGLFNDTTVGNTQVTNPYYPPNYDLPSWNYYDDMNGGWQPGDLPGDPDIWMMWERDDDGDGGWAESWVGCRLLSSSHVMTPAPGVAPVSYNAFAFRQGPIQDDTYWDESLEIMVPGRYQTLGNGHFDSGITPDGDFSVAYDWNGMLSTGPVASLAAGDTLRVTYAMVCGDGQWELMRNSLHFSDLEAAGWNVEISPVAQDIPRGIRLDAAVPNPFNPSTKISFSLDQAGWTQLEVYGLDGRLVAVLVDEMRQAGEHQAMWHGRDMRGSSVASGMYLYRLTAPGGTRLVGHMTLVK